MQGLRYPMYLSYWHPTGAHQFGTQGREFFGRPLRMLNPLAVVLVILGYIGWCRVREGKPVNVQEINKLQT